MAFYRRSYRSRRRTGKRARPRYTHKSTPTVARKALYLARKANRKELKYVSVSDQLVTLDSSSGVNNYYGQLATMSKGTDVTNRIGDAVEPTSINVKVNMSIPAASSAMSCTIRVILFQWKSETYSAADYQILQDPNDVKSYKNFVNRYQSNFLMDRTYSLSVDGTRQMQISLKRKLSGIIAYPSVGTTTIPNRNGIYILVTSSVPNSDVAIRYTSRLYFHDS